MTGFLLLTMLGCSDPDGPLRIEIEGQLFIPDQWAWDATTTTTTNTTTGPTATPVPDFQRTDGTLEEFYGRGIDTRNELDASATLEVKDFHHGNKPAKWEIGFDLSHGQLTGFGVGETYVFDSAQAEGGGLLGLAGVFDYSNEGIGEGETGYCCIGPTWYAFTVESVDDSQLRGSLIAEFANGVQLRPPEDLVGEGVDVSALSRSGGPFDWFSRSAQKTYLKVKGMQPPTKTSGGSGDGDLGGFTCVDSPLCIYYSGFSSQFDHDIFKADCERARLYVGEGDQCASLGYEYCYAETGVATATNYLLDPSSSTQCVRR